MVSSNGMDSSSSNGMEWYGMEAVTKWNGIQPSSNGMSSLSHEWYDGVNSVIESTFFVI